MGAPNALTARCFDPACGPCPPGGGAGGGRAGQRGPGKRAKPSSCTEAIVITKKPGEEGSSSRPRGWPCSSPQDPGPGPQLRKAVLASGP